MTKKELIKLLNKKHKHGEHKLIWKVSNSSFENKSPKIIKTARSICFATLKSWLNVNKANYLQVTFPLDNYPLKTLSKTEMIRWISLAKKNKLLPYYVKPTKIINIEKEEISTWFKLRSIRSRQELYVYLSMIRHIKEDPGFIKCTLALIKEGVDYFTALAIGDYFGVNFRGHDILDTTRPYPETKLDNDKLFDITKVKALKIFAQDLKYSFKSGYGNALYENNGWHMHSTIRSITKNIAHKQITFKDLTTKESKKYIEEKVDV
jgi:hypothetical protein